MACVIDLVSQLVKAATPYLVDPITSQFKYLFMLSNNVNAMVELRAKRESIEQDIQIAEREGKTCCPEVKLWLGKVDAFDQREVTAIEEAYDQRTNCIAMPSLNIVSNYKLGRRAFKKKEDMVELLVVKFEVVAKKLPPGPARELATPSIMVSNENSNLETICQFLKENTAGIIGIWGMGGVGKTTLLKSINNEFYRSKDGMFDHVIWVVVSQDYSYQKIRSYIAKNLGLPSTNGDADADADAIHDFLKMKSFLLLLDDLWSELDLEKIGVPHPKMHHDQDKHKRMMVFTTRSENVCGDMEANKMIKIECLDHDTAWRLFKEKAGEELIASDNLIQQHAKAIVGECAGLPLALVTVGKAMRTKKTAQEWEYVASMMRKSKYPSIPGMRKESYFFPILKFSYDNLESDILRQCYLYCSLWGEDVAIDTNDLIECWMGHGMLDDFDDLGEAYNKGGIFIGNLKEACLLESVAGLSLCDEYQSFVKLHDVIRDLALWITSDCGRNKQGWLVQPKPPLERLPEDVIDREVINIRVKNIKALDGFPNCHKLKTLILFSDNREFLIAPEFFTKMRCLKYLDLIKAGIKILPEEIGGLIGLEYLRLPYKLRSLPMALGDLKNLKYLYILNLHERKIPYGMIARLTKLQVLDLFFIRDVYLEERHVDELLILEELKGVGINIKPSSSTLERLRHVPKRRLRLGCLDDESDFTSISISPSQLGNNSKTNLLELAISDIRSLQELVITTEGDSSWCLSHLNKLDLDSLPHLKNVIWKDVETHFFLPGLVLLYIRDCHSLTSLCWTAHLPLLKYLKIESCDKLKSIIKTGDDVTKVIKEKSNLFKSLELLQLHQSPNLECIYEGELSLPSIEMITVIGCDKLRKLQFGLDSAKNLNAILVESDVWDNMDWAHKDRFSHLVFDPDLQRACEKMGSFHLWPQNFHKYNAMITKVFFITLWPFMFTTIS
ncbi:P-loop containing nucleoside triphosphate hydrolase protein [Dioscorea alata]|uniref:P-loop containing nucleoside triphosphate hydrolase protein n=1 Tax=Dioscorea alata TaxID=55571 RepID=A0ACB7VKB7_DIOAL|nr:P-loop containing nucleoside triphosphate hydrolase protein [Dioscorea alata]